MIRLSKPNIGEEEIAAVAKVLRSGNLVCGNECHFFEKELAEFLNVQHAIVVSSGTAALHLSLIAMGVGPGDAVIVPDFTFPATANVVELVGARPIFVDVDIDTYCISPVLIKDMLDNWNGPEKIKAIMPVHEFGCPADMSAIMNIANEFGLEVIEDAACALGALHKQQMIGTFGKLGCFSFHPRKSLTTGEGGAIITNDKVLAEKLKLLRSHGRTAYPDKIDFVLPGYNYRMTEIQAAIGREQLKKIPQILHQRRVLKKTYDECLSSVAAVHLPKDVTGHSWQTYMIRLDEKINRDKMIRCLFASKIEAGCGAQSLLQQSYFSEKYGIDNHRWNSTKLFQHGLAIPFCELFSTSDLEYISKTIKKLLIDIG